ncbi:unnamed protein product [Microthlaspi erraticum]|uniref:F-box associated beta-propeller type 1 domain-containing protein n=1 Tax=Microthlaspi erraticum TaxID=1685480 RepID=A0A6D2JNQ6_9BRAS|nr:unnamed protein product [Microthlaspi erraticum]
MHIGKQEAAAKASEESRMIVMKDYNVCLTSVVFVNENENENPLTKRLCKLTWLNNEQVKISQVFHCDGLVLCVLKDDNTRLVVCNPYLGQTRWIETKCSHNLDKYKYAIGYESKISCRRYKILRFKDVYIGYGVTNNHLLPYETYDFDSNSWTLHKLIAPWNIAFRDRGVSLKGNTYWCATDGRGLIHHTVCFDFTRKRFGGLQDLPFHYSYKQLVALSCVRDDKLSLLVQSMGTFAISIWITDKIEEQKVASGKSLRVDDTATKVSWSKFLRMDIGPLADLRISDGRFFIEEEKKVAMVVNKDIEARLDTVKIFGEDGYFRELELGEPSDRWCWPVMCSYVPSLVQITLPKVGKRNSEMLKKMAKRSKRD